MKRIEVYVAVSQPHSVYRKAVITGASSGIGEAFARCLASAGCDLVLVARSSDRLTALASEVTRTCGVRAEVFTADLSESADLDAVAAQMSDPALSVDLLVNGAGVLGRIAPLVDQDPGDVTRSIELGTVALAWLTGALLPGMIRRRHGGVINISSVTAFLPAPGGAAYAATKSFAASFSESVHGEARRHGVHVTALCPGSTGGTGLHGPGRSGGSGRLGRLLDPGEVALEGLRAVAAGQPLCIPGQDYRWRAFLCRVLPRRWVREHYYRRWSV